MISKAKKTMKENKSEILRKKAIKDLVPKISKILAKDNFADVYSKDKGMIEDFLNTHLEDIKGQKDDEIADEFQEWFYANFEIGTDLMNEDMAKLREHFKRFK